MDEILDLINVHIVNPYITHQTHVSPVRSAYGDFSEDYSVMRQFLVMWTFLYLSSIVLYYIMAAITFQLFFLDGDISKGKNSAHWVWDWDQMKNEMFVSTWSLFIMSGLTGVMETMILCGWGKLYKNMSDYSLAYFLFSPILFLLFTDFLIYWIHRGLHHPTIYWLHKLHHKYKLTTPFSAFSFHPLDGFAQSFPYHLFVFFFPMHSYLYLFTLLAVGLWTVNIHDRVTFNWFGVNGAAHHTIHHVKFNYNYGQYFTWCDKVFGTYNEPLDHEPYKTDFAQLRADKKLQ